MKSIYNLCMQKETFHRHLLTRNCGMLLHIVVCMINGLNMQFQISSYSFVNWMVDAGKYWQTQLQILMVYHSKFYPETFVYNSSTF